MAPVLNNRKYRGVLFFLSILFLCLPAFSAVKHGTIFPVTEVATQYNFTDNYYETSASKGVYFVFVAPADGAYAITLGVTESVYLYYRKYSDSDYTTQTSSSFRTLSAGSTAGDSIALHAGDSVFFKIIPYASTYHTRSFTVKYSSLPYYSLKVSSSSPMCRPSLTETTDFLGGRTVLTGLADAGARVNGWTKISGSYKTISSSNYSLTFSLLEDSEIELQCVDANLVEISTSQTSYTPANKYYEIDPSHGIRYRYKTVSTDLYVLRLYGDISGAGTFGYYGGDSTFANRTVIDTAKGAYSYFSISSSAIGESFYIDFLPKSESYYNSSIAVSAARAAIVQVQDKLEPDTIALNDPLNIAADLKDGEHFVTWSINAGTGTFGNKNWFSTTFRPTSVETELSYEKEDGVVYPLNDVYTSYSFLNNGSKYPDGYGVRLSFEAEETGNYFLFTKGTNQFYLDNYQYDDAFASRVNYNILSSSESQSSFSIPANTKVYFALRPYSMSSSYFGTTIQTKIVKALSLKADTIGCGYTRVGTGSSNSLQNIMPGTSVSISAFSRDGYLFEKWERVSGQCAIVDSSLATTSVSVSDDCVFRARFVDQGKRYAITEEPVWYSTEENYYYKDASDGVHFYFAAPASGGYVFTFTGNTGSDFKYFRYSKPDYKKYDYRYNFDDSDNNTFSDTVSLQEGDSVFFSILNYDVKDLKEKFSAQYGLVESYTVTLTSSSPQCSTSISQETVAVSKWRTYYGYGKNGYRADGWVVVSGSGFIRDSSSYSISDSITENTVLELQCKPSDLIDISSSREKYVISEDFNDKDPANGLLFRYVSESTDLVGIRAFSSGFTGYFYYYGNDSTFYTRKNSGLLNVSYPSQTIYLKPSKVGETHYFKIYTTAEVYYQEPVEIQALPVGVVKLFNGNSTSLKNYAVGDGFTATPLLPSNNTFVQWTIQHDGVTSIDSSWTINFNVKSDTTLVEAMLRPSSGIYPLTDEYSYITYREYGSTVGSYYSIKAMFHADEDGYYTMYISSPHGFYNYVYSDSLFTSNESDFYSSNSLELKRTFSLSADANKYFLIRSYNSSILYLDDSVKVRVLKSLKVRADTVGSGVAYVGSYSRNYDSTYVKGDSVYLRAIANAGAKFSHWEVVSGSCKIKDEKSRNTYVHIQEDCSVKATFVPGEMLVVQSSPTEYSTAENYYAQGATNGVRYSFTAPATGQYAFVMANESSSRFYYYRYPNSLFSSASYSSFGTSVADAITLSAGQTVYFLVKNYYTSDSLKTFWFSYSTRKGYLSLLSDGNGSISSSYISPIWTGAKYPISATGVNDYRFDRWQVVEGKVSIDDLYMRNTLISVKDTAKIKATFKKGQMYELSTDEQQFNFLDNYYSDNTGSAIRFTWTAPDSIWYVVNFEPVDPLKAIWSSYGTDVLFGKVVKNEGVLGNSQFVFKGIKDTPVFWTLTDSTNIIKNASFKVKLDVPYELHVEPVENGTISPSDIIYVAPGRDTTVIATALGGYVFSKWEVVEGSAEIAVPNSSKTKVLPLSKNCMIRPSYVIDLTTNPSVDISSVDLSNHPGVCVQVSVRDENNGKSIAGLDSSSFILFQDGVPQPVQVSTVQDVGGVSVVLVVDESASMAGTRLVQAKNAIREFINAMGPYDRTAIVGFLGGDDVFVRQSMTSDKKLLLEATESLSATGSSTNINTGAYVGVQQVLGETNPTTVILFSDGASVGSEPRTTSDAVNLANSLNTSIYTIGLENNVEEPLKSIADQTGGSYTYAPSAADLANVYAKIRLAVQSQYVVCFQNPDTTIDGNTHEIIVKTKFLNKESSDTIAWNEAKFPPVVTLTEETWNLVGESQPRNAPIEISIKVNSKSRITNANLFIRPSSLENGTFNSVAMHQKNDSVWTYTVPAADMLPPGIDFYATAMDSLGYLGKVPAILNPSREPFSIPVVNKVPSITSLDSSCIDTADGIGVLDFAIYDGDGIYSAVLHYKDPMSVSFTEKPLVSDETDSRIWAVEIPASMFKANRAVEYYVRAVDSNGVSARCEKQNNIFKRACEVKDIYVAPDEVDDIILVNESSPRSPIVRSTGKISLSLKTQNFSENEDTVSARVYCLVSGDEESDVKMVESSAGHFKNVSDLIKNEYPPKKNDGRISCAASDTLVAEFLDPVYGTVVRDSASFRDSVDISYRFLKTDSLVEFDSLETSSSFDFRLRVTAISPTLHFADTISVLLFTDRGDSLWVKAVETDAYSSEFECISDFTYVESAEMQRGIRLDGILEMNQEHNRVVIQASLENDLSQLRSRDSIVVYSNYIPADSAEIYDKNFDGKADYVRIHFKKKLTSNIVSVDSVFWNSSSAEFHTGISDSIVVERDSLWVGAPLKKPFDYGVTAADQEEPPYLRVTKHVNGFSQKVDLTEKIGPVPVKAEKYKGEADLDEYLGAEVGFHPDTLVVTMSEPMKKSESKGNWQDLFRVSSTCSDTASLPVSLLYEPSVDSTGTVWTLILKDFLVMVDNCLRLNPASGYVDYENNPVGMGGTIVLGDNNKLYIYEISASRPISGSGKPAKWIPPGGDSWQEIPDTLSVVRVKSVSPYRADISIFDGSSNEVVSFSQEFGYKGEMDEDIRKNDNDRSRVGFIYWNQKSNQGRKAGSGVYIWKILFRFPNGKVEEWMLKTGILRRK